MEVECEWMKLAVEHEPQSSASCSVATAIRHCLSVQRNHSRWKLARKASRDVSATSFMSKCPLGHFGRFSEMLGGLASHCTSFLLVVKEADWLWNPWLSWKQPLLAVCNPNDRGEVNWQQLFKMALNSIIYHTFSNILRLVYVKACKKNLLHCLYTIWICVKH